jgi:rhamnosyltransferase
LQSRIRTQSAPGSSANFVGQASSEEYVIAAVVVLYRPDAKLLDRLIRSAMPQVDGLFVVDNTPGSAASDGALFEQYQSSCIHYQALGKNTGIAFAQNAGIAEALACGSYSHVLLLDQDSALPAEMVPKLLLAERNLLASGHQVASVGPLYVDEKTGKFAKAIRHKLLFVRKIELDSSSAEPVEADYLISSGSLIRVSVLREVGLMREDLFIDWVDIEWGLRARDKGWKCYIVPNAVMKHSIGHSSVAVFGKEINLHTDVRNYYIVRNATYLLRCKSMGWQWRAALAIRIPQYVLFYSWCSPNRVQCLKLLVEAVGHGLRGRLGKLD